MGNRTQEGRDDPAEPSSRDAADAGSEVDLLGELADGIGLEPIVPNEDGMYLVRGRVTAEVGAALVRALGAAEDALYSEEPCEEDGSGGGSTEPASASQMERETQRRWADAIGLVARRALVAGLEEEEGHGSQGGSTEPRPPREPPAAGSTEPPR